MTTPHICLSCRRALGQLRTQRVVPWQQRATFISLNNRTPHTGKEADVKDDLRESAVSKIGIPRQRKPKQKNNGVRDNKSSNHALESLFQETLHPTTSHNQIPIQPSTVLESYKNVDTLKNMLLQGGEEADAWLFFVEHFGPDAEKHPFDKTLVTRALMKDVIMAKRKHPLSESLPNVTEISTISYQLGLLVGSEWSSLVVDLIESILVLRQDPSATKAENERLFSDLLGAWNVICRPAENRQNLPTHDATSLNWSHLPRISTKETARIFKQSGCQKCFGQLTPAFQRRHTTVVPLVAAATFKLLLERSQNELESPVPKPLMSILARIIGTPDMNLEHFPHSAERPATTVVREYITNDWASLKKEAENIFLSQAPKEKTKQKQKEASDVELRHPVEKRIQVSIQSMRSKIDKSVKEQDASQTDKLWAIASQWPIQAGSEKDKQSKTGGILTKFLFNKFIWAYMALRMPSRAISVWNCMVENKITPDPTTWSSMLSGCRASRDSKALDGIWEQMRNSKIEIIRESWIARIAGLIECWKIDEGVRALDEMGRVWLAVAKEQHPKLKVEDLLRLDESMVKGAIKPSIETVNLAISALIRKGKQDHVRPVLIWAARYGIAPTAFTYNTLLRPLIRSGDSKAAMKLIQEMKNAGISADAGTFVTIIDETLRPGEEYTTEEQKAAIDSIFDEMEAANLEVSKGLYGHIIHGLLEGLMRTGSRDLSVVNTVMARMAKQGFQPDSVEYTEIVRFLFDQSPPDLAAVDELINRSRMNHKSLSYVFWDRVLEGYSRAGETAKAMAVYRNIQKTSRDVDHTTSRVGWRAMQELILALTRNGEWETAKTVVRHKIIENGGALPEDFDTGSDSQHSQFGFWTLARQLELMSENNTENTEL